MSTERYLHFIGVLQSALSTLKPCCAASASNRQAQTEEGKSKSCTSAAAGLHRDSLSNRFEGLGVEDVEDVAVADIGSARS